jgi:hypothetical protein
LRPLPLQAEPSLIASRPSSILHSPLRHPWQQCSYTIHTSTSDTINTIPGGALRITNTLHPSGECHYKCQRMFQPWELGLPTSPKALVRTPLPEVLAMRLPYPNCHGPARAVKSSVRLETLSLAARILPSPLLLQFNERFRPRDRFCSLPASMARTKSLVRRKDQSDQDKTHHHGQRPLD